MAFERENVGKEQAEGRGGIGFLWVVFLGVFSILILFVPNLIKFFQMVSDILSFKNVFFKGEDKVEKNTVKRNEHRPPVWGRENAVNKDAVKRNGALPQIFGCRRQIKNNVIERKG